jgi:hypothetical protein
VTVCSLRGTRLTGECGKLHNEELNDLYCSPNIVRVIKPRKVRGEGHVARMGKWGAYRVLMGKPEGKDNLEEPGVDGRMIILRRIFRKWDARHGLD